MNPLLRAAHTSRLLLLITSAAMLSCGQPLMPTKHANGAPYSNGVFHNNHPHAEHDLGDILSWQWGKGFKMPDGIAQLVTPPKLEYLQTNRHDHTVTWIGHSTFLIQAAGLNILTDPMFSERTSPLQWLGPKRYTPLPLQIADLPTIDVVIISHNHYDHLDLDSVKQLAKRSPSTLFLVPLGLQAWFKAADIPHTIELDWWQSHQLSSTTPLAAMPNVTFTATPAQHFSSRSLWDKNETLWASWAINIDGYRVFFAGDTGYSKDFANIGEQLGPFDLGLIPIGAYAPTWFMQAMHVNPEEAIKIHQDIAAKLSIGMHWGTFVLTDEPTDEPPQALADAALRYGLARDSFITLQHGETRILPAEQPLR